MVFEPLALNFTLGAFPACTLFVEIHFSPSIVVVFSNDGATLPIAVTFAAAFFLVEGFVAVRVNASLVSFVFSLGVPTILT